MAMEDLKDVKVLIIDPSGYSKNLLRQIMLQLGLMNIEAVANTTEALDKMRLQMFDVVFCDENCAPLEPTAFIKALRQDLKKRLADAVAKENYELAARLRDELKNTPE